MKSTTVMTSCCVVLVLVLVTLPSSSQASHITRLLKQIDHVLASLKNKRGCIGYMCSYSHMSSSAGQKALHASLMRYLYNCAKDPKCGKRKRRSVDSVHADKQVTSSTRRQNKHLISGLHNKNVIRSLLAGRRYSQPS